MSRVRCVFLLLALPAVFSQIYHHQELLGSFGGIDDCNTNINGIPVSSGSGGCNININGRRVLNGDNAQEGEFSYQANVKVIKGSTTKNCGGSVIHKRWILTAAHCIYQLGYSDIVTVTLGTTQYSGYYDVDEYGYESIIIHPNYSSGLPANDIGLIRLDREILLNSERVSQIKMAPNGYISYPGTIATVSGWGRTQVNDPTIPEELQKADLVVISEQECLSQLDILLVEVEGSWKDTRFYQSAINNLNTLLCTNPLNGAVHCAGDSGSPLVTNGLQIGIVQGSYYCNGFPGLYTKVSSYSDWVKQQMLRYSDYSYQFN